MNRPRWTENPRLRWIGLSDVMVAFVSLTDAYLLYGAVTGQFNGSLRALLIYVHIFAFGAVVYYALGQQAAEGGAEVAGEATGGGSPGDGEESDSADSDAADGGG